MFHNVTRAIYHEGFQFSKWNIHAIVLDTSIPVAWRATVFAQIIAESTSILIYLFLGEDASKIYKIWLEFKFEESTDRLT